MLSHEEAAWHVQGEVFERPGGCVCASFAEVSGKCLAVAVAKCSRWTNGQAPCVQARQSASFWSFFGFQFVSTGLAIVRTLLSGPSVFFKATHTSDVLELVLAGFQNERRKSVLHHILRTQRTARET